MLREKRLTLQALWDTGVPFTESSFNHWAKIGIFKPVKDSGDVFVDDAGNERILISYGLRALGYSVKQVLKYLNDKVAPVDLEQRLNGLYKVLSMINKDK